MKKRSSNELALKVIPFGPNEQQLNTLSNRLMKHSLVRRYLDKTRHRLLYCELKDSDVESKAERKPALPNRFRATFYDYTNNRTIYADGLFDKRNNTPKAVEISESSAQPLPSKEEFDEAVKILRDDKEIRSLIETNELQIYPPMPPLINTELPDGSIERTVAVGLIPKTDKHKHEIVGVNMINQTVNRFESRAPSNSQANAITCGLPYASQPTAQYIAGQVWVTVTQGGTVLWRFLVVRPAASSGTNGSGVELRYVDYRGKRVLYRGHVPILNVKYTVGTCGPYRDWQNEEGMIHAVGTDVAPGFRLCSSPATTILDTGSDTGNFLGVAIYVKGLEVVIVSEMEAAWYRYISEWRLHANGTIRPRFGFSAVNSSSCVCNVHHHHAYWRFDFDVRTAGNNRVKEFNNPPIIGSSNWHNKNYEIKRFRNPTRRRKWRVENTVSGEAYDIIPGSHDGTAISSPDWPFPRGDVWILRYRGTELDDGVVSIGPPYEADLDRFTNGESINAKDVVVWYSAHFSHDTASEPPGIHGHIVGPDLIPVRW
jgi:Cu2+-containing amine oxidase